MNGAVIGFLCMVFVPIAVHLKCVWIDRSSGQIESASEEENNLIQSNKCECNNGYKSKMSMYIETIGLIFIVLLAFGIMILTFTSL